MTDKFVTGDHCEKVMSACFAKNLWVLGTLVLIAIAVFTFMWTRLEAVNADAKTQAVESAGIAAKVGSIDARVIRIEEKLDKLLLRKEIP